MKLLLSLCAIVIISLIASTPAQAGLSSSQRLGNNVPGVDLTIFRTVNNLTCHPQNPLLEEIPLYINYNADGIPQNLPGDIPQSIKDKFARNNLKGYCFAMHAQADSSVVGVPVGSSNLTGDYVRPKVPWRHAIVMEVPNPDYCNPDLDTTCTPTKFTGKYIHWEGMVNIFEISIGSGAEVWYNKDFLGNMLIGQGKFPINKYKLGQYNNKDVWGSYIIDNSNFKWETCKTWSGKLRPGDENLPCFAFNSNAANHTFNNDIGTVIWNNPTNFSDIPHTSKGKPLGGKINWLDDDGWVKCKNELQDVYGVSYSSYIANMNQHYNTMADPAITIKAPHVQVFPVMPSSCEYDIPTSDPGARPDTEAMIHDIIPGAQTPTPTLTPTPTGNPDATPTPITQPTVTPTPTIAITPTPNPNDTTAPITTINFPANNTVFSKWQSYTSIEGKSTDYGGSGIRSIELFIDDVSVKSCTDVTKCTYFWGNLKDMPGVHTIKALGTDNSGNISTYSITITKQQ